MITEPKYEMRLSLNILEHLGINLYSNVPSVLAEIVANSWDADATVVNVEFDAAKDTIIIQDNGDGMDFEDVNNKFLTVGYRRREGQPGKTRKNRSPMGRKGIGKLSLFSIAKYIKVETAKSNEVNAFEMRIDDIREKIKEDTDCYYPTAIPTTHLNFEKGTKITLSGLKKKQTFSTIDGLRKRLARRFSIIGPNDAFAVNINGKPITPSDIGYFDKLQCLWTYGGTQKVNIDCPNVIFSEDRTSEIGSNEIGFHGWLGTVGHSNQLKDDTGENLNRIAIFVRGKMAQEDILGDFTERGVYASYLVGELYIDDLDKYDGPDSDDCEVDEDAATSSRQKIVEDDPRYEMIKEIVSLELKHIQKSWAEQRSKEGSRNALQIPAIKGWINCLSKDRKKSATRWLGKINQIRVDDEAERRHLWKHAIIAFEFYSWGENLNKLETIDENNIEAAINLFNELDNLEFNLYGQIVKERVEIIRILKSKVDADAFEKAIQEYIFDHLWLLDPAWERVEASEFMESRVETIFKRNSEGLTNAERHGRIDIGYRKTAGKHVIVELKRPSINISVYELSAQIGKYRSAMLKLLDESNLGQEPIEIVCILGNPPIEWSGPKGRELVEGTLAVHNARYVDYEQLLNNAFQAYADYSEKHKQVDRLTEVIRNIENFVSENSDFTPESKDEHWVR